MLFSGKEHNTRKESQILWGTDTGQKVWVDCREADQKTEILYTAKEVS